MSKEKYGWRRLSPPFPDDFLRREFGIACGGYKIGRRTGTENAEFDRARSWPGVEPASTKAWDRDVARFQPVTVILVG